MSEAKEQKLEHAQGSAEAPLVIGIGASAGGLEALQQFFGHMPTNSGLSFVVVQHLSPITRALWPTFWASTPACRCTRRNMRWRWSRIRSI